MDSIEFLIKPLNDRAEISAMIDESELISRTEDACKQLTRYGGYVWSIEFVELLEKLSDINDDCWHGRLSKEYFDEAKELLYKIAYNREFK